MANQEAAKRGASEEIIAGIKNKFEEQQRAERQAERKARKEQAHKERVRWTIFGVLFLAGLLIVGFQAFVWLRDGEWVAIPLGIVTLILPHDSSFYAWLGKPDSWYGLHQTLVWIFQFPLSLTLIAAGGLAFWLSDV